MYLTRRSGATGKKAVFAGAAMLLILVALTYREAPNNSFHFDDQKNIYRYPPVMMSEFSVDNVIEAGFDARLKRRVLPSMTFAVDWWRGGGTPRSFQITNVVIHGATTVAVFVLLFMVFGRLKEPPATPLILAFLGAAIWACHPIQVQAVTYIVQRMTSMAALFTILTVIFYILGRRALGPGKKWLYFVVSGLCWLLGLASKETAAIAPFLILLAEYGVLRHADHILKARVDYVLLGIPPLIVVLIIADLLSGSGPLSSAFLSGFHGRDFTWQERLLTQPRVIGFHLSQFLWPLPGRFSLEHDFPLSTSILEPRTTVVAIVGVFAWCFAGVWCLLRQNSRIIGFFVLWVPATLVIESSIVPLEMIFEHRMYLPSVALVGLLVLALGRMAGSLSRPDVALVIAAAAIILGLALSTSRYVPVWATPLTIAENNTRHAPESERVWSEYAIALKQSGAGLRRVRVPLVKAMELDPEAARPWSILAISLRDAGSPWETIEQAMKKALELDPDDTVALNLRAIQLIETGKLKEAEKILDSLTPRIESDQSILNTFGMLRLEQGDFPRAIELFERVTTMNRFEPAFQYNLALSYELAGRCRDANLAWQKFLQIQNDENRRRIVLERLQRNFATPGGRCFGVTN
jgi:Flp pilus assembly protein TadD